MRIHQVLCLTVLAAATTSTLGAQNLMPFGNFQEGALNWTMTRFNDTKGTTGFTVADVTTEAASEAVFANFQTLTPVMSATYISNKFFLPKATFNVTFNVMWDKGTITRPIPSPSVNRVELRIYDSNNTRVFNQRITVPNQTGTKERASFKGSFAVPAVGNYTAELFLRHSNLANMPYTTHVDDLVIGTATDFVYHKGCPGANKLVPLVNTTGSPAVNSQNFTVNMSKAPAAAKALLGIGLSNTKFGAVKLPFDFGNGCLLSQDMLVTVFYNTGRSGAVSQPLPIPNDSKLKGTKIYFQFAVDDKASSIGFTTTAGVRVTVL